MKERSMQRGLMSLCLASLCLAFSPTSSAVQLCDEGCQPSGGGDAIDTDPFCGSTVAIEVDIDAGDCRFLGGVIGVSDDACAPAKACWHKVRRTWENLPPNKPLTFCVETTTPDGTINRCMENPTPSSGPSGSGSHTVKGFLSCNGYNKVWSFTAPCAGYVSVSGSCTLCEL